MKLLFSNLFLPLVLYTSSCFAEDAFSCNADAAQDLNLTDTSFASVRLGWVSSDCGPTIFAPDTIHWHIYSLPSDSNVAKIFMSPPGLVTPKVENGMLQFSIHDLGEDGYKLNDEVQAGVAIWLPADQMRSLALSGVDEIAEVVYNGTESLTIKSSGVDNEMFITSPNAPVHFTASGVDNIAQIQAGAGGSSVQLSGVDGQVSIAVPDDSLTVQMSGVDSTISIDGGYRSISIDSNAFVSTNCDSISSSGIGATCQVTNPAFELTQLGCLADTIITEQHVDWGFFLGAIAGVVAVVLGLIILVGILCVCGCVTCCCFCAQKNRSKNNKLGKHDNKDIALEGSHEPAVAYAERVDPENAVDPHLLTAKTGTEADKMGVVGTYS